MSIENTKILSALLAMLTVMSVVACGGGGGDDDDDDSETAGAQTELQFAKSGAARLDPSQIAVVYLEPSDATTTTHGDTEIGVDRVPYTVNETTIQTFSLSPAMASTKIESMEMLNSSNTVVFKIDAANLSATVTMVPGDYELIITANAAHTKASIGGEDHNLIFIRPVATNPVQEALSQDAPPQAYTVGSTTADCPNCALGDCDFTGANMMSGNFRNTSFSNSTFVNAQLDGADITGSRFQGANLTGASLINMLATGTDFDSSTLNNAILEGTTFTGANFSFATMTGADASSANFGSCNMEYVTGTGVKFTRSDLTGCRFQHGNFSGSDFSDTQIENGILTDGNFSNSTFDGADLTNANIKGATFTGSTFNQTTWIGGGTCTGNGETVDTCTGQ